jgi:hypothetical protein
MASFKFNKNKIAENAMLFNPDTFATRNQLRILE